MDAGRQIPTFINASYDELLSGLSKHEQQFIGCKYSRNGYDQIKSVGKCSDLVPDFIDAVAPSQLNKDQMTESYLATPATPASASQSIDTVQYIFITL